MHAVEHYGARCFVLVEVNHLSAEEKARIIMDHHGFMEKMAQKQTAPFVYRLHKGGHRDRVRLP